MDDVSQAYSWTTALESAADETSLQTPSVSNRTSHADRVLNLILLDHKTPMSI